MVIESIQRGLFAPVLIALVATWAVGCSHDGAQADQPFEWMAVDRQGPVDPWGTAVGDINADGYPDLLVGGRGSQRPSLSARVLDKLHLAKAAWSDQGELVWYQSPGMEKHLISDQFRFRTDLEVADVNGDGSADVVALTDQGLVWFEGPAWQVHVIDARVLHDVEAADLDGDGDLDLVARGQTLFGYNDGNLLHVYWQGPDHAWTHVQRPAATGEGLKVADMNADGAVDIVINQHWYANPGHGGQVERWPERAYCPGWDWPHAYLDVHDMDADGQPDVVMAPAEPVGRYFRLSWCAMALGSAGPGAERVVDERVETVMHSVVAGDFDLDGLPDLVAAQMVQGIGAEDVALYRQADARSGEILRWKRAVLGQTGSHSMKAADIDQDGDLDLLGANWSGDHQPVEIWRNLARSRIASGWRRHVIDDSKPWRSVFVQVGDLNGDGRLDIATGRAWYPNPGHMEGPWPREAFGMPANNLALLHDWNGDGSLDVLASTWSDPRQRTLYERAVRRLGLRSELPDGGLVWASNDGRGHFTVHQNVASGRGDFLQGSALVQQAGSTQIALSWHEAGQGIQLLQVPSNPSAQSWTLSPAAAPSQDEALSVADIDRDGRLDLVSGTRWLRGDALGSWTPYTLHDTPALPDRHQVVDMNGDGRLDVVVGFEAVSRPGGVAWYEQGPDPTLPWIEHRIAQVIGPMSLSVADMDGDGDLDVIVGEHNLMHPQTARLLWFENRHGRSGRWVPHTVYTGDEHHGGALVVDIDGDGDLDVVSIGWGHDRLHLYENRSAILKPQQSSKETS